MNNPNASLNPSTSPIAFNSLDRANNILQAIQQTINALAAGLLDDRTARTILYGLQIASANVKRAGKDPHEISREETEQQPNATATDDSDAMPEHERTTSIDPQPMHEDESLPGAKAPLSRMNADTEENEDTSPSDDAASHDAKEQPRTASPHTYRGSVQLRRMELQQRALRGRHGGL